MPKTILDAIINITSHSEHLLTQSSNFMNRANNMGDALENYIKDAFAGTFNESDESKRMSTYSETFSWLGNQNNPPDLILHKGDAIEVKKTESANTQLALNSSHPNNKIYSNSPMITEECKNCEEWNEKDLIYCVGHASKNKIHSIWLVYGSIYAANQNTYTRIKDTISSGINTIGNLEFSETKELGRVNKVDPLGITNLRIRGMWHIQNPRRVYNYLYKQNPNKTFELVALIPEVKWNSFPENKRFFVEQHPNISVSDKKVKNPNNPAKTINIKLVTHCI